MNDSEFKRLINDAKKTENTHLREEILNGLHPGIKGSLITLDRTKNGLSKTTKKLIDFVGVQKCLDNLMINTPIDTDSDLYKRFNSYLKRKINPPPHLTCL